MLGGMNTSQRSLLPLGPTARYFRVPAAWLRAEADAGRVPCVRAGSRYLFSVEAVERVLLDRAAARDTGEAAR